MPENSPQAEEFDRMYEESLQRSRHRPWARPARLPNHPDTRSDKHPDDPDSPQSRTLPRLKRRFLSCSIGSE